MQVIFCITFAIRPNSMLREWAGSVRYNSWQFRVSWTREVQSANKYPFFRPAWYYAPETAWVNGIVNTKGFRSIIWPIRFAIASIVRLDSKVYELIYTGLRSSINEEIDFIVSRARYTTRIWSNIISDVGITSESIRTGADVVHQAEYILVTYEILRFRSSAGSLCM